MGNIASYNPFAYFNKPAPTEAQLLQHQLTELWKKEADLEKQQEQLAVDIAYAQHKLSFFLNNDLTTSQD